MGSFGLLRVASHPTYLLSAWQCMPRQKDYYFIVVANDPQRLNESTTMNDKGKMEVVVG